MRPIQTIYLFLTLAGCMILSGCTVTLNMSGASIDYVTTKTCEIKYITNNAEIVNPSLSSLCTEALRKRIQSDTRLGMVSRNGDVVFEGNITGYNVTPMSVTAENVAAKDRLTITIKVIFTNTKEPKYSFSKTFARYAEYDRSQVFASVESQLVEEILPLLIDDIFNASFMNW